MTAKKPSPYEATAIVAIHEWKNPAMQRKAGHTTSFVGAPPAVSRPRRGARSIHNSSQ